MPVFPSLQAFDDDECRTTCSNECQEYMDEVVYTSTIGSCNLKLDQINHTHQSTLRSSIHISDFFHRDTVPTLIPPTQYRYSDKSNR